MKLSSLPSLSSKVNKLTRERKGNSCLFYSLTLPSLIHFHPQAMEINAIFPISLSFTQNIYNWFFQLSKYIFSSSLTLCQYF
jgi:hypothetical protein